MIISHRHRFIFFAIPKTGTHAVRRALRAQLGPEDVEQVGMFEQRVLPQPELAALRHGHLSVRQVKPVLGAVFDDYLKFAFVRNPFDRFVSYCSFITRDSGEFARDPRGTMNYVMRDLKPVNHILFRPQVEFLIDEAGKVAMDVTCRQETMQQSYDEVCARIGMPTETLERVNSTSRRAYQEYYDDALIALVADFYRADLDTFGYTFDAAVRQSP
jgi:Sulfotransferase family